VRDRNGAELCAPNYVAVRIDERDLGSFTFAKAEHSGLSTAVVDENETFLRKEPKNHRKR